MRPLGETQQRMLESMREHHGWSNGAGWIWENYSTHVKILESLERRGLVARRTRSNGTEAWSLTEDGLAETQDWQDARDARSRALHERHRTEGAEQAARAAVLADLVGRLNAALGLNFEAPAWVGGGMLLSIASLEAIVMKLEERS